ncbi:C40 family peptidase [Flavobacterium sp. I-SCBP12n]|uniref:C40 family peptidase n=1 Tax=Flavobacterium pygoscelis TaxID=2893176 RepID=A0A9X2BLC0_9FLAO|nr:C40 family peptidase [Flavobacterium pygoscelis]MCK8141638.1 C40 family peptidase [Flavobacterium pygoscelis]
MTYKNIHFFKFRIVFSLVLFLFLTDAYSSAKTGICKKVHYEINSKDKLTEPIQNELSLRDKIINYGRGLLGTPYVAAGCSAKGFDCSGFVYFVFNHFNIKVPRSSSQFKNFGKEIAIEEVQKGDILLFLSPTRNVIGHVGIVTNPKGLDSDFIHSSSGSEMKVIVTSLKKPGYAKRFVKAVRVL